MAVRAGMQHLVNLLRSLTAVTSSEFTDDALQDKLDENKAEVRDIYLTATRTNLVSGVIYRIYDIPESAGRYFELPVEDALNTYFYLYSTTYTPVTFGDGDNQAVFDPDLRRITFNQNTDGKAYYLTVITYDVYGAAADIWTIKCSGATKLVDIKTDNHTIALSQQRDAICKERIGFFTSRSLRNADARLVRSDQARHYDIEYSRLYPSRHRLY